MIILDHAIGALRSGEFARMLKNDSAFSNIPLLLLTVSPLRGDAAYYRKSGLSGYLVYPVNDVTMKKAISILVGLDAGSNEFVTSHYINEIELFALQQKQALHAGEKVLLIEDDVTNQLVVEAMLKKLQVTVEIASSRKHALELFKVQDFSIVFMDCNMPEMNGFETTRLIRQWEQQHAMRSTIIIALTANATVVNRDKCKACGMNDFLTKPVSLQQINDVLKRYQISDTPFIPVNRTA